MKTDRRQFLTRSIRFASAAGFAALYPDRSLRVLGSLSSRHFEITKIERQTVELEFRPVPRRNMDREIPHWRYIELCRVTLKSGQTGVGETMLFYTWGVPSDRVVQNAIGQNAAELMWDDSLGAGLQMALFDAVGKTAEVPLHALLGHKTNQTTPLSWWNIDTSAADMAAECKEALRLGYKSYKTKGRPWFDVFEQLQTATKNLPDDFKIDMDFNDTLRTADLALPILKRLENYPQVDIFETPIPQSDVEGNVRIAENTRVHIAMHYGTPSPPVCVRTGCCDGFVVGGGAVRTMAAGRFCGQVKMPFWLQLVGAGLTAAYSLHFGGVLAMAKWPAVNCHQLFEDDLLTEKISVVNGHAQVPDRPGIGYDIDWDAVEKCKVPRPAKRPDPPRLIETTWPDGKRMYTANDGTVNFMLNAANQGKYPFYKPGAQTRLVPNDGSDRWRQLYEKARREGPVEA